MKLYATVTSERASKGQGGNKYLDIDIYVDDLERTPLTFLRVEQKGSEFILKNSETGQVYDSKPVENKKYLKGKKQKSECNICEQVHKDGNDRHCHLCGSPEENKYCTNDTCSEYQRYE